jgi:TolB-like protein
LRYRFGEFELDSESFDLQRSGVALRVEPRVLEVLSYLVRHRTRVVPKDELFDEIWPQAHVSDSALAGAIRDARRALGESGAKEGRIRTVHGRGFHFVGDVRELDVAEATPLAAGVPATSPSLAVLPFESSGDSETEYLAEGIAESLIHSLSALPRLRVLPRQTTFRARATDQDPAAFARELGVSHVLSGRVLLRGETLIVRAELIDARSDSEVWGGESRRRLADIFSVQEAISQEIAQGLRLRLSPDERVRLARRPTESGEAYRLYLQGRFHWNRRGEDTVRCAIDYFRQAIAADADFALAEVGLADAYDILGFYCWEAPARTFPLALAAARRALEIDSDLAPAHAALAYGTHYFDWDLPRAEAGFRRAIELDPSYAPAHQFYFNLLTAAGRFEEALEQSDWTLALDPLWTHLHAARSWICFFARRYPEALEAAATSEALEPGYSKARLWRGWALEQMGQIDAAIRELRAAAEAEGGSVETRVGLAHALAEAGDLRQARVLRAELLESRERRYVSAYYLALLDLALEDRDAACRRLEEAVDERSHLLVLLGVDPRFDALRADPRFVEVQARIVPATGEAPLGVPSRPQRPAAGKARPKR